VPRSPSSSPSRVAVLVLALLAAGGCGRSGTSGPAAELAMVGGEILTVDDAGTVAQALAIHGDSLVAVGSDAEVAAWIGPDTRVVELDGRTVIPGLTDNHFHGIGGGPGVDLSGARSLADVEAALAARAATTPAGEVIVTNSDWHEGQLAEQRLPYRDDLDAATPEHPVVVVRGGHQYVLNSAALERWGIRRDAPPVAGGRIGRYPDGRLNGELVDRAKGLVELDGPEGPATDPGEELLDEHRRLHALGLTSVRYPGGSVERYELLRDLHREGRLTMRVDQLFRAGRGGTVDELLAHLDEAGIAPGEGDERLRVGGVKISIDGGFEGGWMREPYREPWGEDGRFSGLQTVDSAVYVAMVRRLHEAGWRVATHAVGDAAMDLVLHAYRQAHADASLVGRRWSVEHGFIARPEHLETMRELGVAASVQNHLYVAAPSLVAYWGTDRAHHTTPLRDYLDAGVETSLGTDSPVIPENPFWVLHHFTTRETMSDGVAGDEQAVGRMEALRAATRGYAWLTFGEERRGSLEAGKLADLVLLSDDYRSCADPCLQTMEARATLVGGQVVHSTLAELPVQGSVPD